MALEFIIKAIIPDSLDAGFYTAYMINDKEKLLLPIKVTKYGAESMVLARNGKTLVRPHVHNTLQRTILAMGGEVVCALIYTALEDVFYAYIRLKGGNGTILDIDARVTDAMCLALRFNKPILVEEGVVEKETIKITRELLQQSLEL